MWPESEEFTWNLGLRGILRERREEGVWKVLF